MDFIIIIMTICVWIDGETIHDIDFSHDLTLTLCYHNVKQKAFIFILGCCYRTKEKKLINDKIDI